MVEGHGLTWSRRYHRWMASKHPQYKGQPLVMADTKPILYHAWGSSASRKVRLCLVEKGLDVLEDLTRRIETYVQASGGPWLFGERLTLADIAVAPYVVRFEEERAGRMAPGPHEWWSRFTSRPAWRLAEIGRYENDSARSAREAMADPI